MDWHLHEWAHLLLRWAHFLLGIMWVGNSFFFVWLDSSFRPPKPGADGGAAGVGVFNDGETEMVHGGYFYHVQKRRYGAGAMPGSLHWFKWEATLTWVTGFLLLTVVYYMTGGAYLIDPEVLALEPWQGSAIGIATLVGGWFVYDLYFRSPLGRARIGSVLALGLAAAAVYGLTRVFSGRGAFIHVGALFGTLMVLNVWVHILPNQRAIIEASQAGREPDYELGKKAKRRSMHNSYMTLPVLFIMISNHFAGTFGHPHAWLVLVLIIALGAAVRHAMILGKPWPLAPAAAALLAVIGLTATPAPGGGPGARASLASRPRVALADVRSVVAARCVHCHSAKPTDAVFRVAPNDVRFDEPAQLRQWAARIRERAYVQRTMPLVNQTGMTDHERELLATWVDQGARVEDQGAALE